MKLIFNCKFEICFNKKNNTAIASKPRIADYKP